MLEQHPIDFDALKRGDVIPHDVVARAYPNEDEDQLSIRKMQMVARIREVFRDRGDGVVAVRILQRDIRILTPQEQDEYVPLGQRRAMRAFARRHAEDIGNDVAKLTQEQQDERRRRLARNSWLMQQMRKAPRLSHPPVDEIGDGSDE